MAGSEELLQDQYVRHLEKTSREKDQKIAELRAHIIILEEAIYGPHLSDGAKAGIQQINTGSSGCPLLELTEHEIVDLALSGRAFGTMGSELVEIVDTTKEMRKIADEWRKTGKLRSL
jgi:hypothetical protein